MRERACELNTKNQSFIFVAKGSEDSVGKPMFINKTPFELEFDVYVSEGNGWNKSALPFFGSKSLYPDEDAKVNTHNWPARNFSKLECIEISRKNQQGKKIVCASVIRDIFELEQNRFEVTVDTLKEFAKGDETFMKQLDDDVEIALDRGADAFGEEAGPPEGEIVMEKMRA